MDVGDPAVVRVACVRLHVADAICLG